MAVLAGTLLIPSGWVGLNPLLSEDIAANPVALYAPHSSTVPPGFAGTTTLRLPGARQLEVKQGAVLENYFRDFYNTIHVDPASIDVGSLLSQQTVELRVWNAFLVPVHVSSIDTLGFEGIALTMPASHPSTPFDLQPNEQATFVLVIKVSGPPAIDATLVLHTDEGDISIPIVGTRIALWDFMPQTQHRETLTWATDVIPSYAAEQRQALRPAPRQAIQFDYQMSPQDASRANGLALRNAGLPFGIPVWTDVKRVGAITVGQTTIRLDTTQGDWRAGDLVMAWQDDGQTDAMETLSVTDTSVTLKRGAPRSYSDAYLAPLRSAYATAGIQFSRPRGELVKARGNFQVLDSRDLATAKAYVPPYPTYRSRPVLNSRYVVLSDLGETVNRSTEALDGVASRPVLTPDVGYADRRQTLTYNPQSRAERWAVKLWLSYLRGRQKSFWLPSWNQDMVVAATMTAGTVTLVVRPVGLAANYSGGGHLLIQQPDGTQYFRAFSSPVIAGSFEQVTLDSAVATDVTSSTFVCIIRHVRQDADSVELEHGYAGSSAATVAVTETPEGA